MKGFRKSAKKLAVTAIAACMTLSMTVTAFADEPYKAYTYDNWFETLPSQSAYTVESVKNGADMQLGKLSEPNDPLFYSEDASAELNQAKDMYIYDDSEIWIADTKNNRILRLNKDFEVTGRYYSVTGKSETKAAESEDKKGTCFKEPGGIFVMKSPSTGKQTVYIADTANSRVVRASVDSATELTLEQEYVKPKEALYEEKTFNPSKVIVDYAENVYTIVKSVNKGSVQFKKDGSFTGYYGSNRVEVTASLIAKKLWRKVASNEQLDRMESVKPIEYANFDIDDEGFVYTVTEVATETDAVKKINPAGYNIWNNEEGDTYEFGDRQVVNSTENKAYSTKLTDIAISSGGMINILDYESGRVFQYDKQCNPVCIFGAKSSNADQRGTFLNPNALDTIGEEIIVLEGSAKRNDITIFKQTTFGKNLTEAYKLYDEGLYVEAAPYWEEVLKRDGGYTNAYKGLGKADLKNNNYKAAMKKFKIINSKRNYDRAFEYYRKEWLQQNFTIIGVVVLALVAVWVVSFVMKKRTGKGIFAHIFKKRKKKAKGKG